MLAAGTEFHVLNNLPKYSLVLRGGIRKNVAASYDSTQYSIGIGFTFMSFTINLGFAYSPFGIPIEEAPGGDIANTLRLLTFDYFPDNWQLAVGFSLKFGGKKDKKIETRGAYNYYDYGYEADYKDYYNYDYQYK